MSMPFTREKSVLFIIIIQMDVFKRLSLIHIILGKGSHQDLQPIKGSTPDPFDRPTGCQFAPRCEFSCEKCNQMPGETMVDGTHMVRCFKYKEVMNSGK